MQIPSILAEFQPKAALVLGSGLGSLVDRVAVKARVSYSEIPGLPVSTVPGHSGELILAEIRGVCWALFKGRVHLYEGRSSSDVTAGVRLARTLGCHSLILTNAAGTLNPSHPPGSWMQITDHLNLTATSPLMGGPNFVDMSAVYSPRLVESFASLAQKTGATLHHGVYAGLLGPQYETPAEIRMLRVLGADAVGMSTVLEAIQARALGMEVAGFSCLTNWAAGMQPGGLDHGEVLDVGQQAAAQLCDLLLAWDLPPPAASD